MTIALGSTSAAWAAGTSPIAPALPASWAAGDLLVAVIHCKPTNTSIPPVIASPPAGWTQRQALTQLGTQAQGADTGAVWQGVFERIAVAGDTAPSFTITNSNVALGLVMRFTKAANETWDPVTTTSGADTTSATSFSVTGAANLALSAGMGDYLAVLAGPAGNATQSAPSFTATGAAFGTIAETVEGDTTTGNDLAATVFHAAVTSGTSTAAPVISSTLSLARTGGATFMRIRVTTAAADVTDTFNRADAATLGSTETGQPWEHPEGGTWSIVSNQAKGPNAAGSMAIVNSGRTDAEVRMVVAAGISSSLSATLLLRVAPSGDDYYVLHVNTLGRDIKKCVNGVITSLTVTGASTIVNGDEIGFKIEGSNLTALKNGVAFATATDSAITTGTRAGTKMDGTNPDVLRFDDFRVRAPGGFTSGTTVNGNQATETDTANAGSRALAASGSQATQPSTVSAGSAVIGAVGAQAISTATASSGTPRITVTGSQATSTALPTAGAPRFGVAGSQATQTTTANAGAPVTRVTGSQATGTAIANAGSPALRPVGSQATNTNTAIAGSAVAGTTVAGSQVLQASTAFTGSPRLTLTGATATQPSTCLSGAPGVRLPGGQSLSTDVGRTGAPSLAKPGGQATQPSTAVAGIPLLQFLGNRSTETDTANAGSVTSSGGQTTVQGSQASQTNTANAGSITVAATVAGSLASQTNTANAGSVTFAATVAGSLASQINTAFVGSAMVVVSGQMATSVNEARPADLVSVLAASLPVVVDPWESLALVVDLTHSAAAVVDPVEAIAVVSDTGASSIPVVSTPASSSPTVAATG